MLEEYRKHVEERAAEGIVPKPLSADQVAGLVELLKNPPAGEEAFLLDLLTNRVPAGVDEAAYVKAAFLTDVAKGNTACGLVSRVEATRLLGTMLGGYNIPPLVELLDDAEVGQTSAEALHAGSVSGFHPCVCRDLHNCSAASLRKYRRSLSKGGPSGSKFFPALPCCCREVVKGHSAQVFHFFMATSTH